jgi:hypothetical protein
MKKFTENKNLITESNTVEISLEDKIQNLIETTINVQLNEEPIVNENYTIEGKEEIKNKLIDLYNRNLEISKKYVLESIKNKYSKNIDIRDINENIENLKK